VTARRKGEPQDAAPPPTGSFGEAAAEMANESEVEEPMGQQHLADAPDDISGVEEMVGEGAPLDPADLLEGAADETADDVTEPDPAQLERALSERTSDLQRLQAEYVNYKRRVDRDRELVRENATYAALAPIVEVLDTIDRAREHGDLDEGFQAVAEQLERVVANAGLVKYGEPGEPFDPRLHEALSHIGEDPEVEVTTCKVVAKAGYRIGQRVVRAAQVLVVDPVSS
jgi:molecular chaperone GrpE